MVMVAEVAEEVTEEEDEDAEDTEDATTLHQDETAEDHILQDVKLCKINQNE
jgi:hypothetical protein